MEKIESVDSHIDLCCLAADDVWTHLCPWRTKKSGLEQGMKEIEIVFSLRNLVSVYGCHRCVFLDGNHCFLLTQD